MPNRFIVQAVLKTVRTIPGYPNLKVLDLSCGEGEILGNLHDEGCIVEGTHYCPDDYIIQNPDPVLNSVTIHNNISLAEDLPFDSERYDLVVMTEVLEHLPNHFQILKEVTRIVKPGGFLVVTTPNLARLHSRLQFFLTGTHKLIRSRIQWDTPHASLHEYHINPVDFPLFHTLLKMLGFSITTVAATQIKKRHLYLLLFYPLIFMACLREFKRQAKTVRAKQGATDLFKKMTSLPLLCSEQILVCAQKASHEHNKPS